MEHLIKINPCEFWLRLNGTGILMFDFFAIMKMKKSIKNLAFKHKSNAFSYISNKQLNTDTIKNLVLLINKTLAFYIHYKLEVNVL